jgi:hypothetical protein
VVAGCAILRFGRGKLGYGLWANLAEMGRGSRVVLTGGNWGVTEHADSMIFWLVYP